MFVTVNAQQIFMENEIVRGFYENELYFNQKHANIEIFQHFIAFA